MVGFQWSINLSGKAIILSRLVSRLENILANWEPRQNVVRDDEEILLCNIKGLFRSGHDGIRSKQNSELA